MGAEEDAGATVEWCEAGDEIGAVGLDFLKGDFRTEVFEVVLEEVGHQFFAGDACLIWCGVVGVDRGDADEVLEEHGSFSTFNSQLSTLMEEGWKGGWGCFFWLGGCKLVPWLAFCGGE